MVTLAHFDIWPLNYISNQAWNTSWKAEKFQNEGWSMTDEGWRSWKNWFWKAEGFCRVCAATS